MFRLSTAQTIIRQASLLSDDHEPMSSDCPQQNRSWCRQHHVHLSCQAQGGPAHADDGAIDMPQEAAVGLTLSAVGQQHKLRAILTHLTSDSLL